MPTFFEALKRIIQGKPVYDASNEQPPDVPDGNIPSTPEQGSYDTPNTTAYDAPIAEEAIQGEDSETTAESHEDSEHSSIVKNDPRTFPVAFIHRTITKFNGSNMLVYCYIRNAWNESLDLHKIEAFEKETELKRPIHPGEEHEFLIYEGPQLESPAEHLALLAYKTETGDYFEAIHEVTFKFNYVAKSYYVDDIRLRLPIKDIYG